MKDLSLHILDIAQNSVKAGAKLIDVTLLENADSLVITITDDGRGMSPEFLKTVTDPFVTTRTTRKVGLGLPLYRQAAELTGGSLDIASSPGSGTTVRAVFFTGHIDCPPLGDLPATVQTLVQGAPDIDFHYRHEKCGKASRLDTREMRGALGGVPLCEAEVLNWIYESLKESEETLL
ncbi:MAG: ATP-binding protein [Oscillospiraceae bacterium]|nr:ATP-binding protein [Oscillospiraceae bacterium]